MTDYTSEMDVMGNIPINSSRQIAGELFAGAAAGSIGIVVGVPFDFVKVRMQTYSHLYQSSWHCFKTSIRTDGFLGLYRGLSAPIAVQGGVNALLFAGESFCMRYLEPNLKSGEVGKPMNVFLAGSFGGLFQCLLVVPSDVIKCNMQIGTLGNTTDKVTSSATSKGNGKSISRYSGIFDCIHKIYRKEGYGGFYRGFSVTAVREIPSLGVYFSVYRYSKDILAKHGLDTSSTVPLMAGALAGSASWACIYPIDVVKSNMQVDISGEARPKSTFQMTRYLYNKHGISVFFRGLSTTVMRAIPVNATTFYFYEHFKKAMNLR